MSANKETKFLMYNMLGNIQNDQILIYFVIRIIALWLVSSRKDNVNF